MQKALKPSLIAASIMLSIMSQQASATNGYAAHGFGTIQKAMGGAAVAGHDNAMNIATNPASMSFGKNNWTAGVDIFAPDRSTSFTDSSGTSNFDGNDDSNFVIPEFAYQRHLNDKFAVGIAVYGNGGMNATYDRAIFGPPTGANSGIDFAQLFIAPSVSMKLGDKHSVGVSLNLAYQRFKINGVTGFGQISTDPSSLSDNDYDDSTGAGITLGWQGKLTDTLTAGLAYRSETSMSRFKDYQGLFAENGDFNIPSQITGGISVQATPRTTLALDVSRIHYTDVNAIANKNNSATGGQLGATNGPGFGWEDQTIFKFGVKHQLNNKVALMAGYNHGSAPIQDTETAFNILAPAVVEDHLTLGLDYKLTNKSNVSVQYMHAFNNKIKGAQAPGSFIQSPVTGEFTTADIEMQQNSFGVAYSRDF